MRMQLNIDITEQQYQSLILHLQNRLVTSEASMLISGKDDNGSIPLRQILEELESVKFPHFTKANLV